MFKTFWNKQKKKKKVTNIEKSLDGLWSLLVKMIYGRYCAVCLRGENEVKLYSHHLVTRGNRRTRWMVRNGIVLCAKHHTGDSECSVHRNKRWFAGWIKKSNRAEDWSYIHKIKDDQNILIPTRADKHELLKGFRDATRRLSTTE